jgi:hypothetical protein
MAEPQPAVGHHELLGHAVRLEPWGTQGESTYSRVREALAADDVESSVTLAELTIQEAQEAHDLYLLWLGQLPGLLSGLGVADAALASARELANSTAAALVAGWSAYGAHLQDFATHARAGDPSAAVAALEAARSAWQSVHDPATDALCALIAVCVEELGEDRVGPLWDQMLSHYYAALGEKYDPATRPWSQSLERLVLDIFEATRGHLSGPDRDGSFEIREESDRWVVTFEPCGSGGRTYAEPGAAPSRTFTRGEHDWAWRTKGVCHYCVHCCQLQQRAPIERLGMPLRVIEPPTLPAGDGSGRTRCTWSLYKDPALLPHEAFTSVGAPIPAWLTGARQG